MISSLKPQKVLVIGDFMVDVYTMGNVERISPEAPVPVLHVSHESRRAGGAGNAILNLVSLGMEVVAVGRVGEYVGGRTFLDEMAKEEVDTRGILSDPTFQTPLKNRIIAAGQQLVRIDYEHTTQLTPEEEQKVLAMLPTLLNGVEIIAISDYAKGFLTQTLLSQVILMARQRHIPVVVDPKGIDFTRYRGATLLKPNLSEAISAAGLGREATLEAIASKLLRETEVGTLMITRSKEGISLFSQAAPRHDLPASVHEVKDVTGAGDTVLAVVTAALANRLSLPDAARLANVAAGIAIERLGCARISLSDLAHRLQTTPS